MPKEFHLQGPARRPLEKQGNMGVSPLQSNPSNTSLLIEEQTLKECKLIVGGAALSAQLVLLIVVVTALIVKRHRERPRRAWSIWLLDVSKQGCSAGAGHVVGMMVAILAHITSHGASECGWYFVVYFGDCTLGLCLAIAFHKLVNGLAHHYNHKQQPEKEHEHPWWEALVDSGHYGDPPQFRRWLIQVVFWVLCVVTARSIVGIVVISSIPYLQLLTTSLDKHFEGHPDVYIFTVMVGIPVVINIGQAWIQDQVLKLKHRRSKARASHSDDGGIISVSLQPEAMPSSGGRRGKS